MRALTTVDVVRDRSWWHRLLAVALALLAMALLFGLDQLLVNLLGHGRG